MMQRARSLVVVLVLVACGAGGADPEVARAPTADSERLAQASEGDVEGDVEGATCSLDDEPAARVALRRMQTCGAGESSRD